VLGLSHKIRTCSSNTKLPKLYTRSLKRGDVRRIFENLVYHGATEQILIDAHPHIGTNKLPKIIQNIRETILKFGGEINFNTQVTDFIIKNNQLKAIVLKNGNEMTVNSVILATGHSARDMYELLHKKNRHSNTSNRFYY